MVDDYTKETIRLLASILKKPKLSMELLRRPPFRFIHDIVMELVRVTGFASTLFSEFEKSADSLAASRDAKLGFLNKLISCVYMTAFPMHAVTEIPVEVSANKILAGLEPENTNSFLQLMAVAATDMRHTSRQACDRVLAGELVTRNHLVTPRPATTESKPVSDIVFSSDESVCSNTSSFEKRPLEAIQSLLNAHHPEPNSGEPLFLLSRLLLWHSPSSVLSQSLPDFNFISQCLV